MIAGQSITVHVLARTLANAAATGLIAGDFLAICRGVNLAKSLFAEGATVGYMRVYSWSMTLPSGAGFADVLIAPTTANAFIADYQVVPVGLTDTDSISSIVSAAVVPSSSIIEQGGPSNEIGISLRRGDFANVSFIVQDINGLAVDLSGYNNPQFGVRDANGSPISYLQTTAITMSALGVVAIEIPESASFYAALATGVDSVSLFWSMTGDQAATSTKTRTLGAGSLIVRRREVT